MAADEYRAAGQRRLRARPLRAGKAEGPFELEPPGVRHIDPGGIGRHRMGIGGIQSPAAEHRRLAPVEPRPRSPAHVERGGGRGLAQSAPGEILRDRDLALRRNSARLHAHRARCQRAMDGFGRHVFEHPFLRRAAGGGVMAGGAALPVDRGAFGELAVAAKQRVLRRGQCTHRTPHKQCAEQHDRNKHSRQQSRRHRA